MKYYFSWCLSGANKIGKVTRNWYFFQLLLGPLILLQDKISQLRRQFNELFFQGALFFLKFMKGGNLNADNPAVTYIFQILIHLFRFLNIQF